MLCLRCLCFGNDGNNGYDSNWFASAYVSRNLFRFIGLYGEAAVAKSTGGRPWAGTMGAGATLTVSPHTSWDLAVYRGLSGGASDWNHVLRFNYGF